MRIPILALHFIRRDLRNRYLGSFSGGLWALAQPLIQLGVYGFVFSRIFPQNDPDFLQSLALALWPWVAFSEALVRSTTAIQDNAALIGKIALPREVLVLASVASSFVLHVSGFVAICIVLAISGSTIHLKYLPIALYTFIQLFVLATGISFLFAALQVFVRDLASALPQLITLWMFASPIFYKRATIPAQYQSWLDLNPFSFYAESIRAQLLGGSLLPAAAQWQALAIALVMLGIGLFVFRRLGPHFEEFL